jgi:hypothetical protein
MESRRMEMIRRRPISRGDMGHDHRGDDAEEGEGGEVRVSEEPHGMGCGGPADHKVS